MPAEKRAALAGIVTIDKEIMHGTPCFTGTRVPVQTLLDFIEAGDTLDKLCTPSRASNASKGFNFSNWPKNSFSSNASPPRRMPGSTRLLRQRAHLLARYSE